MMIVIVYGMILLGLIASLILFHRFPGLNPVDPQNSTNRANQPIRISIIIPARNEEKNLALLLADLKKQRVPIHEIICIDDGSIDQTAEIARGFGTKLITATEKPPGWMGKSWACQQGGEAATGEAFLFLDADVRLGPGGLEKLLKAYQQAGCVISVLPYHQIEKKAETFSLFFNLIQMGANGIGLSTGLYKNKIKNKDKNSDLDNSNSIQKNNGIGLYGPVILISRWDYQAVGGHAAIKASIVDDMALGAKLREKAIPFSLFLGDHDVSYRMYSGGLKELVQGWTKNQAAGALKTPFVIILLVFFWITSCASVPFYLAGAMIQGDFLGAGLLAGCYLIWVLELFRITRHIGSFGVASLAFYPLWLIFYLMIFLRSMIKKIFGHTVIWKDRTI